MADKLSVYNEALVRLGVSPIATLTDSSAQALSAASLLDDTARRCLAAFPWSFATREVALSELVLDEEEYSSTEFDRAFQLPSDRVRVLGLRDRSPFFLSGDRLYTDGKQPRLVYIRDAGVSLWTPLFRKWVVMELAAALAITLTDNVQRADMFYSLAPRAAMEARAVDSQETPQYVFDLMAYYRAGQRNPLGAA